MNKLQVYSTKFKSKTLRLCFSSEQELFSIFYKIFGADLLRQIPVRKVSNII